MDKLIPTRYDKQIDFGGSTKPWTVFAIKDSEIGQNPTELPYVVKLFSPTIVEQHPCIAKEFICNLLATEFDLFVPTMGIINLHTPEFLKTLKRKERDILKQRYDGNTFASRLLTGALVTESSKDLSENIQDRAMIYAFDCFIYNIDRWGVHKKANLMLFEEQFILIDHELSLPFIDGHNKSTLDLIFKNVENETIIYPYKNHLFYNSLRDYAGNKMVIFNTFHEYLNSLNVVRLRALLSELQNNSIYVGEYEMLFEYIRGIKSRSAKFCEALLSTIL